MRELVILGAAGVGTFALRVSFITRLGERIPTAVQDALRNVLPAVLGALVATGAFVTHGEIDLDSLPLRASATVVAAVVAWKTRNVIATMGAGMALLWCGQTLF
ncbi:MAG: AzlD domain-containing protein [Actinomycetota bacterium]|nr:AzlD domain-containing protein [Actinomycetota bacterium]